ncbi:WD repeat-containing protein 89 isoform X2 [Harpegnathos saltator]|uniref:WD repeat-containing protein 89 isoform X2 n=1 Tax=Harpegnathos saltator TaxID=610380 RepID=UPI0005908CFC|nr:WD repeat-containing protein 89 isoform X2 [Harpegnathos saltator]
MAKVIDSLKKLNVGNDSKPHKNNKESKLSLFKEKTNSKDGYIYLVYGTQCDQDFKLAHVSSNDKISINYISQDSIRLIHEISSEVSPVMGIKFSPASKDIFYSVQNGEIKMFDLREQNKLVGVFRDDSFSNNEKKTMISFDVSYDQRLIVGATECTGGDSFILFWDVRYNKSTKEHKNNLLGGYWESHMDDITDLSFNSVRHNVLASGSTDGLINVFDLTQPSEAEALMYSLNTMSSVDKLGWSGNDSLWCTTHTHVLQLWNCEDAGAYATFERRNLMIPDVDVDYIYYYIVRYHATNALGKPFLLTKCSAFEDKLWCLSIAGDHLEVSHEIVGNKQEVRDSWMHEKSGTLVTVGEHGTISLWRQKESAEYPSSCESLGKIIAEKNRQHRSKPYFRSC